jgi:beta-glucosidase
MGGGPIDMTQWINNVPAILQAWYPGMEGGNALAKIIFGQVNPSGKLPMTFPKILEDAPSQKLGITSKDLMQLYYTDDIYVGYRYFDTYKVEPQFAFGHGLSYTTFEYSNLKIQAGKKNTTITFTLKNTGSVPGAEVAQVYVKQEKSTLPRPEKELKAFEKIFLQPGDSKLVKIVLDENAFHYYNDIENKWVMENGVYDIMIGASSRKIKLNGKVKL